MARKTEKTVAPSRDTDVIAATRHTTELLDRAERLTNRLNVHLDQIQALIDERKRRG